MGDGIGMLFGALALLAVMIMNVAHFARISERHELDAHDSDGYDY